MTEHSTLTPPELAKQWRVKPERIIAWIKSGELRAFDVSSRPGVGRPRYRIPPDAVIAFENRRAGKTPTTTKRRRRQPENVISYF